MHIKLLNFDYASELFFFVLLFFDYRLFLFDSANASFSRSGNSLVFETPGGGSVTVTDFFVVGDQSLPTYTI